MEENVYLCSYHLAIVGRVLGMGSEELADLLAKAKSQSMGGKRDAHTGPRSRDQRERVR